MTRRTRKILFFGFLLIFLLSAPLMILYYQGYRFDFEKKSLTQTGGLFLKVIPKQTEIYIDGKLVKKTDFFFGSTLIENLLPKKYKIEIKKEGYFSWEKILEIRAKEVTEAKNIVLFSENINFEILLKNVENLWFSPNEKEIVLKEIENGNWVLKLYDLKRNIKSRLIGGKDIYTKGADLMGLEFSEASEDSKEIYLDVGMKEQNKKFVLNLEKIPPLLTEKEIATPAENIVTSQTFNGDNYYLDNFGHLFKSPSAAEGEKLTEKPFPIKSETKYVLEIFGNFIFLEEDENLYLFNTDSKSFDPFLEKIRDLKISPDGKKLVYFSDSEIWVLFLKEKLNPLSKKAGEKILLVRLFSEKIESAFWLNSDYLIFNAGDKIKIAEIDERDKLNIIDLAEVDELPFISTHRPLSEEEARVFKNPEIFFNQIDRKLYVLSDGNLFQSSPLLP